MKIFYSWQLDAPRKTNKDFIHTAIVEAIAKLSEEPDLEEAEREEIEVDQDTQGVPGSPDIAAVIFEKIAAADVFAADVSLVARGGNDKHHINSNVAIELGYAYGKTGFKKVLKVMNTHYGPPTELPFDLRGRRHPVKYCLAPDADAETIKSERKQLVGTLKNILKEYLNNKAEPQKPQHEEVPPTALRGQFWEISDVLVPKDTERQLGEDLYWYGTSILYFRCIPEIRLPDLSSAEAMEHTASLYPLLMDGGCSRRRNKWGAIAFSRLSDGCTLIGATQVFRNRELWGVDTDYSQRMSNPDDEDEEPRHFLPVGAINREYPRTINNIRKAAEKLSYGDRYTVEMGLAGAEDVYLGINGSFDPWPGPIFEKDVYVRMSVSADQPTEDIINAFWSKAFDEAGVSVPEEYVLKPQ
ncbi:hypothetical protein [Pseudooceanicola sp. LIPI14-2-Ac024]|uniref:hypothetical protein n=1 Tax=Pseudooceanicola sp. LIPI14-2-Ac024 TaxID=3344875 RepID=UPI0035CF89D0